MTSARDSNPADRPPDTAGEGADVYDVQPGDTLWTIAANLLGDPRRWREIFELNRDREMADGQVLCDHDVIEPGWRLTLPPLFEEWSLRPYAYLSSHRFRVRYPEAYAKWATAEEQLHLPLRGMELTLIGHLCRESLQAFTATLLSYFPTSGEALSRSHTVAALRHVLEQVVPSKATASLLDALLVYWGCVNDLAQRQVHGATREGTGLSWEDARRLVFQSAVVMYEVDRCVGEACDPEKR